MIVRKIKPEERRRTEELFSIAFATPLSEDAYPLEKYAAFLDDNETMTSCLSVTPYSVNFDGSQVNMAGIGGVSSLPHYRRTGGIRGCFEAMLPTLYREGYMLSMLYPFSTNYYRKFGYEVWSRGVRYELILSYLPAMPKVGHAMLVDADNRKECLADIQALTELWEMHYNGMAKLDQRAYGFVTEADPYRKQEFVYVYYDSVGVPAGYMVFRKEVLTEGQRLVCSRFVFRDKTGLLGLLALAKSFAADYKSIVFVLPRSLRIDPVIDEWAFSAITRSDTSLGMVRFINVEAALLAASYRGEGEITLDIWDNQIPENNGVFYVRFRDGRAIQVEHTEQKTADLRMEISEFSRFLMGAVDTSALAYSDRVAGYTEQKRGVLGNIFYEKPCFLTEYF